MEDAAAVQVNMSPKARNPRFRTKRLQRPDATRIELALRIEPVETELARIRMLAGKKADPVPISAQGNEKGKTRDKLAKRARVGKMKANSKNAAVTENQTRTMTV